MHFVNLTTFCLLIVGAMSQKYLESHSDPTEINQDPESDMIPQMRRQAIRIAEANLRAEVNNNCFILSMCLVGTKTNVEVPRYSMVDGIRMYVNTLREIVEVIKNDPNLEPDSFPNIHRVLSSFNIGKTTKDMQVCSSLFPCEDSSTDETMAMIMRQPMRDGRATCKAAGALCPGVSIGCALCGIFSPGTCGTQCIVAGLYCGVSGYACQEEAKTPKTTTMAPMASLSPRKENEEMMTFLFGPRFHLKR